MNIFLWILQVIVALYCGAGAVWRILNYSKDAQTVASVQALSHGAWIAIGGFEILCALGLLLPGILGLKGVTAIVAVLLTVEMLLVTGLHAKYFGFNFQATNPAIWTLGLAIASAFIAYGRFAVRPL